LGPQLAEPLPLVPPSPAPAPPDIDQVNPREVDVIVNGDAKAESAGPAPGVYKAVPFSGIVVVPPPIDLKFVLPRGDDRSLGRVITPPGTLVPFKR
jgi:hypothetical protein